MAQYTIGNSAVSLGSAAQLIQNLGTGTLYVGDASVTAATGVRVNPGEALAVGGAGGNCYGISDGTADVRTKASGLGLSSLAEV